MSLPFVAQMSMEGLLNGIGEGVLIALFGWVLLRLIGRRNAGTRFAMWFCALVAIACAPFLETSTPPRLMHPAAAAIMMPREWSWYLFAGWAVIALAGMARVLAGLRHLQRIRKACVSIESAKLDPTVAHAMKEFRPVRSVELCVSEAVQVPIAIGFFRPAVVLPSWALQELSLAELHALVLHELAHLRRWDDWTNLAQKVLRALFFFHPAVWWVERRLSLEREMACDDLVLAHTSNPRAYAECLVSLAEKSFVRRGLALAQAAVGRMQQTSLRVLQILDARRPDGARIWKPAPWLVAGFSVACLGVAAHAPKLVAFGDPQTSSTVRLSSVANLRHEVSSYTPLVVPASHVAPANGLATNGHQVGVATRTGVGRTSSVKQASLKTSLQPSGPRVHKTKSSGGGNMSSARVVRASFRANTPGVVVQQAVLVVGFTAEPEIQREDQEDRSGVSLPLYFSAEQGVLWHVSIWRITIVTPAATEQSAVPAKSI